MIKIGFIGGGNMGGAIISGILRSGMDAEIHIVDSDPEKVAALEKKGVIPCESAQALAKECRYIFLAIKPQTFDAVLPSMNGYVTEENVIVSIAEGITEDYIINTLGVNVPAVIVMPNTPFLLGEGATALAKGKYT
ncbi:MAG: NAD(P)-binding domain-containing protein, partial [Oscillospiraceae bacterium]|nr:NAD(P)-binding domain-containing protein [Oscillospiraceae bacterium]